MRILQVSSHYPPHHNGGAERCCAALSRALRDAGHDVCVAAPVPAGDYDGIEVRALPGGHAPRPARKLLLDYVSPGANAVLDRIIADFRPDVVHVHNVYGIGSALIAHAALRAPTIVTMHDYWAMDVVAPYYTRGVLRYPAPATLLAPWLQLHRARHRRALRDAALVAPSRYLAARAGAALAREITVVPNGVAAVDGASPERTNRVVFVGRIAPEKGLAPILPALTEIATAAGWTVDIAGDGPLLPALRQRFTEARWHGSMDPRPLYATGSVLIVPSIWPENAPSVVLEGMANGIAVLASAAGGIPEMLKDGEQGLLHTPGDVRSFADGLRRLLSDPALRLRLGDGARTRAGQFRWDASAAAYLDAYASASSVRRVPAGAHSSPSPASTGE